MIIQLRDMVITVQRIRVIWMYPFQRNFGSGAVHFADEEQILADSNIVGIFKYLIINFCKTMSCVAVWV